MRDEVNAGLVGIISAGMEGTEPKWREINLTASVPGWTRFPPAEEWIRQAGLNDGGPAYDSPRHAAVTDGSTAAALSAAERDAIFKDFVDYRKRWTLL